MVFASKIPLTRLGNWLEINQVNGKKGQKTVPCKEGMNVERSDEKTQSQNLVPDQVVPTTDSNRHGNAKTTVNVTFYKISFNAKYLFQPTTNN